jgi:hypothetical protein
MTLFAEMGAAQFIFLGAVVLVTLFLLLRTSRYFTRPKSPDPSWSSIARKPKETDSPGRGSCIPQEMAGWEVEMHEFVREIKAELDSKMRALQAVTADADRAADRLETALRGSPNSAKSSQNFREDVGMRQPGIDLSNLPASQAESLSPAGVPRPEHSSVQAKKEEIYTLADYNMPPAEIASRVGHPVGEVELILSLRAKK